MTNVQGSSITQTTKTFANSFTSITTYSALVGNSDNDFGAGSGNNLYIRGYNLYKVSNNQVKFTVYTDFIRQIIAIGY